MAAALWDYGEDELAVRAVDMTDADLASIENISAWYEGPAYRLPMSGQHVTHNHVNAFAAITRFEGRVRPLAGKSSSQRDRSEACEPQRPSLWDRLSREAHGSATGRAVVCLDGKLVVAVNCFETVLRASPAISS